MTGSWRPVLRLAVRDAKRDRGRSLLVLVLVALPVAGLIVAAAVTDSVAASAEENAVAALGRADAGFDLVPTTEDPSGAVAALVDALPDGSEVEIQQRTLATVPVDGLALEVALLDAEPRTDALAAGQRDLVDGRVGEAPDEVVLSTALLERAGLEVGDRARIEPLGEVTVVGASRLRERTDALEALAAPAVVSELPDLGVRVLVALPDGAALPDLEGLAVVDGGEWPANDPAFTGETRDALTADRFSRGERWALMVVGGLAAVEVALVAGAAFAVSVRRRQRELGLLAATGGTRRDVRRSVLLSGVSIGVAGAVAGTVVGVAATFAVVPWAASVADRVVTGTRLDPIIIVVAALLGTGAAVLGAWWPARSVARLPVLVALSGRRPTPAPARTGLWKGLVLVAVGAGLCAIGATAGAAIPFLFLGGAVAVVLGAGLTSPWLLEQLGRTARFLPVGPRLAVRDAARFRTRNGPIVTAAMAGLAASITVAALVGSIEAAEEAGYQPGLPEQVLVVEEWGTGGAATTIASAVGRTASPLERPAAPVVVSGTSEVLEDGTLGGTWAEAAVLPDEVVEAIAGPQAVAALRDGRAVPLRVVEGAALELWSGGGTDGEQPELLAEIPLATDVEPADPDGAMWRLPAVLLPPTDEVLANLPTSGGGVGTHLIVFPDGVDDASLDTASRAASRLGGDVVVVAERGFESSYGAVVRGFTIVGGLAGLLIVTVAVALAAVESRRDLRTLAAVGAGRRTRRSLAAGRALLLSSLGGLLAVPVGLLPAASLLTTIEGGLPLIVPWPTVLVVAVLVPALVTLGAVAVGGRDADRLARAA
ncbi:ABC transporter permease [Nitriliruptoraceae bacterium ZYF776]|nr:ABC transporter permease [Profundirhabdus halotolerans]